MAPTPTTLRLHTRDLQTPLPPPQTWSAALFAESERPTATMCFAFSIVTLLVLGLLLYTGRRWDECNARDSFRRRICVRCRDEASSARAAAARRLRHCHAIVDENMELMARGVGKDMKEMEVVPVSWHGSNLLNTPWGWMS